MFSQRFVTSAKKLNKKNVNTNSSMNFLKQLVLATSFDSKEKFKKSNKKYRTWKLTDIFTNNWKKGKLQKRKLVVEKKRKETLTLFMLNLSSTRMLSINI